MSATLVQLAPDLVVLLTTFIVIVTDLFVKKAHATVYRITLAGICLALGATGVLVHYGLADFHSLHPNVRNVLIVDNASLFLKALVLLLTLLTVMISYSSFEEERLHFGEYYTMLLFTTLGEMLAVSSQELITFFLCFELLSLPLYMLAGFRRYNAHSAEAGVKYFLTGALSSAIMLYGMSFIYGSLGTTIFSQMPAAFQQLTEPPQALMVGLIMVVAGLAFKVSAAPFHNWAPDVYEGAPSVVCAYLSTAPKAAMIAVILRFFWVTMDVPGNVFTLSGDWVNLFCLLSVLSMFVGNLSALAQTNVKRMLAYSGVAQMGYVFLGLAACAGNGGGVLGGSACLFYVAVYGLANLGAWAVVTLACSEAGNRDELRGLAQRSPFLAFVMVISLMSLAGVPPLAGFVGKFALFRAIYQSQLPFMVLLGLINSVISLYYYFLLLREVYFREPEAGLPPLTLSFSQRLAVQACLLGSIALGVWPGLLYWTETIAAQWMGARP